MRSKMLILIVILLAAGGLYLGQIYGPTNDLTVTNIAEIDTDTKPAEPSPISEAEIVSNSYALTIKQLPQNEGVEFIAPQTEIFLAVTTGPATETRSLGLFPGTCTVNSYINVYEPAAAFIETAEQVINQVSCWFAGSGSETYLYKTDTTLGRYQVISFETGECGDLPENECTPYAAARVLTTVE